jgi:hypothetical protein
LRRSITNQTVHLNSALFVYFSHHDGENVNEHDQQNDNVSTGFDALNQANHNHAQLLDGLDEREEPHEAHEAHALHHTLPVLAQKHEAERNDGEVETVEDAVLGVGKVSGRGWRGGLG